MPLARIGSVAGAAIFIVSCVAPAFAVPPKQPNGKMPSIENKKSEPMGSAKDAQGSTHMALVVPLKAQNGSGEGGTATLRQVGKNLLVTLHVTGSGEKKQPAHIHLGTCSKLDPAPKYPLTTIEDGKSVTTIKGLSIATLANVSTAVNVHESTTNIKKYVACGNIKRAAMNASK